MCIVSSVVFLFNSCTSESYYDEENAVDHSFQLNNFKTSMQNADKDLKSKSLTNRSIDFESGNVELSEQFVQQISGDALLLIKSYGVTEQDLINEFGSLDPEKISMTAQIIMAEEDLLDEGKTLSIFTQEDYQLSALSFFGVNSTYAGGGNTVGGCLLEAIGIKAVVQVLVGDLAALGTAGVLKIVGNVASKYAGVIGGAVMVYQFADCMGWLTTYQVGGPLPGNVSTCNDVVMVSRKSSLGYIGPYYISKSDISFKSETDFIIESDRSYKTYNVNITANIEDTECNVTMGGVSLNGGELDISTVREVQ